MMILDAMSHYEKYRQNERQFSSATWRGERSTMLALLASLGVRGRQCLHEVTTEDMEWWFGLHNELALNTMVTRVSQVRRFFAYCIARGWMATDPTSTLVVRRPMAEPRERLTAAELLALIETADYPQHRIVLALAANLGLRAGEIQRLHVSDANLGAGKIRVHVDKTREVDDMPITAELDIELRRWFEIYRAWPSGFLVPSQWVSTVTERIEYHGNEPIATPHRVVQRGLRKLGWETTKQEGVHTVRRSVARIFYDAAVATDSESEALLGTMRLLHHTKPETTLTYIGIDKQAQVRDKLLWGKSFLPFAAGNATRIEVAR